MYRASLGLLPSIGQLLSTLNNKIADASKKIDTVLPTLCSPQACPDRVGSRCEPMKGVIGDKWIIAWMVIHQLNFPKKWFVQVHDPKQSFMVALWRFERVAWHDQPWPSWMDHWTKHVIGSADSYCFVGLPHPNNVNQSLLGIGQWHRSLLPLPGLGLMQWKVPLRRTCVSRRSRSPKNGMQCRSWWIPRASRMGMGLFRFLFNPPR